MALIDNLKGPLNSINQVIFVINQLIDAICLLLAPVFAGTPNTLMGFDGSGNFAEVTPGTGLDLASSVLTVDMGDFDTDDLTEGPTNLYYTDERVDDRVAVLIQDGTGISWVYDDGLGTLTPTITINPFSIDELGDVDTSTITPVVDDILTFDGDDWVPGKITEILTREYAEDLTIDTTTGATITTLALTTASLPAGDYRIDWSYLWDTSSAAGTAVIEIVVNTIVVFTAQEANAKSGEHSGSGFIVMTLPAGVTTCA